MKLDVVGKRKIRVDALSKATGKAIYPEDIYIENMLYGKTLRSSKPHAYIKVNIKEAEKVDGVLKVFTSKDLPNNEYGVVLKDQEVFCREKVRYIGDPIAFVVGKTEEACLEGLKKIKVEYEEIDSVFDPIEAMKGNAPLIHEDSNIVYHYKLRKGDIDEGFKKSDVIAENTYKTSMVDHGFLQPEAGVGFIGEDGKITIMTATQYPHYDREEIANTLKLPEGKIRIVNTNIGGAFGGREDMTMQIHLALAVYVLKKPIKVVYTREESFVAHSKRHPLIMKYRTGANKDGYLQAMEAEIIGDTGAYASWAMNVLRKSGVHSTGPYTIPNIKVDSYAVYTNNIFAGAMRGFGAAQIPIAHEQQMDILAEKLGLNPVEIRMKNIFAKGDITGTGQVLLQSVPVDECIYRTVENFNFLDKWQRGE